MSTETTTAAEAEAAAVGTTTKEGESAPRKKHRLLRFVISTAIFIAVLVALWPAQYGGITGLTVVSGHSMEPTYHTGDLVVSLKKPSYAPGDVVSYLLPAGQPGAGGRVIHRILSVDSSSGAPVYTTIGDNNPSVDPWHFGTADVLGKAVFSVPSIGSLLNATSNPLIIGLGSGLVVLVLVWRIGSAYERRRSRN
jgi:signal peptidase